MTAPQFKEGQRLELTAHRRQIARLQRWLVLVSLLATLAAGSGAVGFFSARSAIRQGQALTLRTSRDADVTTAALCALRNDLERRVSASKGYLGEHPRGAPGIPARLIRDGIRNQERTISALSRIDC